jgi:hypothetical protein
LVPNVIRIALLVTYLAAAAGAVILMDASEENGQEAMVLWGFASILLGLGTGQARWALLALLVALSFAYATEWLGSDPWLPFGVFACGVGSAVLIVISALARRIDDSRKPLSDGD